MKKEPDVLEGITEDELLEEPEEKGKPILKRIMIVLVAGFMVLLMFSYVYITYPTFDILSSRIISTTFQGDTLETGKAKIIFLNDTRQEIVDTYNNNTETETTLCLEGQAEENTYFITNIYQPRIISQSFSHVTHEQCSDETKVLFHTHPYERCAASRQDIRTLRNNQEEDPEKIMVVMCAPDRFGIYT